MKWKVLLTAEHIRSDMNRFRDFFIENDIEIFIPQKDKLSEEELLPIIHEYDGAVTVADLFSKAVLDRAKKLKVISKWGTGIDTIDKEYAESLGIRVMNTLNAFSEPLSDSVMGYILNFARKINKLDREMKIGIWSKTSDQFALDELALGIIGLGDCGSAVARKASAFGMKIYGNDIVEIPREKLEKHGIEFTTKDEIYEKCDFISLNVSLTEEAKGMITKNVFSKMKKTAVLINTSRGAAVKNADLIDALREKKIAGAALDVFETEPLPKDSPLLKFENCILSPHNVNSSPKYWNIVHENTLNNLVKGLNGGRDE
jgi:D-3-phosphoglycerate dehydrogenase / 2-oxoglutarate reductase